MRAQACRSQNDSGIAFLWSVRRNRSSKNRKKGRDPAREIALSLCAATSGSPVSSLLEFLVLLAGEEEPDASAPFLNAMLQRLAAFQVHGVAAAPLREFAYLLRVRKAELLGKRRFQVRFKELAMPAVPKHVVHVDAAERSILPLAACAKLLPWDVRRRQWRFA